MHVLTWSQDMHEKNMDVITYPCPNRQVIYVEGTLDVYISCDVLYVSAEEMFYNKSLYAVSILSYHMVYQTDLFIVLQLWVDHHQAFDNICRDLAITYRGDKSDNDTSTLKHARMLCLIQIEHGHKRKKTTYLPPITRRNYPSMH